MNIDWPSDDGQNASLRNQLSHHLRTRVCSVSTASIHVEGEFVCFRLADNRSSLNREIGSLCYGPRRYAALRPETGRAGENDNERNQGEGGGIPSRSGRGRKGRAHVESPAALSKWFFMRLRRSCGTAPHRLPCRRIQRGSRHPAAACFRPHRRRPSCRTLGRRWSSPIPGRLWRTNSSH